MRPRDLPLGPNGLTPAIACARPFLRRLALLAARRPLRAARDTVADDGRVLLAGGTPVDPASAERLAGGGLRQPAEDTIVVEAAAPGVVLASEALSALHGHALLARLVAGVGGTGVVTASLARIVLPAPLALHVEMARAVVPALYRHSLLSALACVALGRAAGQGQDACDTLAIVGLCHDIGLLHADDDVLGDGPQLTPAHRAQLVAHPEVAATLLRRHLPWAGAAAQAVAVHHERLDGTGFPQRLAGAALSPWGRIAGLAELLTTMESDGGILDVLRLSNMLRLHSAAFDGPLAERLLALCDAEENS